jgi:hypothetical protein
MYNTAKNREDLAKEIVEHTIKGVLPSRSEEGSQFTLALENPKTGKKKYVEVNGNDLGWWFKVRKKP